MTDQTANVAPDGTAAELAELEQHTDQTTPAALDRERPPASTVWTTASDVRRLLSAVLPFAADANDLPYVAGVHLEAGNGHLAAVATNRYVLGRAHTEADGDMDPVLLSRAAADMLRVLVDPERVRFDTRVVLAVDKAARQATITIDNVTITVQAGYPEYGIAGFAAILDPTGYDQPADTSMIGLNLGMLGIIRDAMAAADHSHEPARVFFRAADKPLRVEVSDWFVALIMPTQFRESDAATPTVPYALPEHPAAVLPDVEKPTTAFPRSEQAATAQAMWAHFAGTAIRVQRRWFDQDRLDLPKRGERTPEQERAAAGDYYQLITAMYAAVLARVFREFAAVAPGPADACAREVWADMEHGDNLTEWPWEWLEQAKIPQPDESDQDGTASLTEETAARVGEQITDSFAREL